MQHFGLRLLGTDTLFARPHFRCDACRHIFDVRFQWRTEHARYCPTCHPLGATRSQRLEVA